MFSLARSVHVRWALYIALCSVFAFVVLGGGCPQPNDPNTPNTDIDDDGIPNVDDPDVDGDGVDNDDDDDIDGDGVSNDQDTTPSGPTDSNDPNDGNDPNDSNDPNDTNDPSDNNNPPDPDPPTAVTLSVIAKTGDAVPDQAAGVTFTALGTPVIDAKGRIAFWGEYGGTGAIGTSGLYVWNGTEVECVFDNDPNSAGVVPGRDTAHYFEYDPNQPDIAWGAGDRLLFVAAIKPASGSSSTSLAGVYRWRATDGNFARVADTTQVAAEFPDVNEDANGNPSFEATFFVPGVSDAGLGVFGVHYTYIKTTGDGLDRFVLDQDAFFTSNGTSVTKIADSSTKKTGVVPDQPADAYFGLTYTTTTINGDGNALFQASYAASTSSGRGVFMARSGERYRVIDNRASASWPGLPVGAQFMPRSPATGYALAIGPKGHIALAGKISLNSSPLSAVILWDWDAATWTELTGAGGAAATALLSGVNDDGATLILSGGNPYLVTRSTRTQVNVTLPTALQGASLGWLDAGGAINNYGRAVVQYANSGKAGLALWTGQKLLVVADAQLGTPEDLSTISTVVKPERDRPGRSGLLNDADELTFKGTLTDGTEVIYLGTGE